MTFNELCDIVATTCIVYSLHKKARNFKSPCFICLVVFLTTVNRFGELIRKIWNPRNFKAHVSPHEMLQVCLPFTKLIPLSAGIAV